MIWQIANRPDTVFTMRYANVGPVDCPCVGDESSQVLPWFKFLCQAIDSVVDLPLRYSHVAVVQSFQDLRQVCLQDHVLIESQLLRCVSYGVMDFCSRSGRFLFLLTICCT
jgi:hypothetical protein